MYVALGMDSQTCLQRGSGGIPETRNVKCNVLKAQRQAAAQLRAAPRSRD